MSAFAKTTHARAQGDDVFFELETDGVTRPFEISGDALRRYFGAADDSGSELLRAFEQAREKIQALAKKAQWVPSDGPIKLGTGDFDDG
ncbi:DUF1488 family protein [Bordetella sp. BOR01]|uniref:DUF1488 family protein n=1 Tax=Bordetella sp. BOR01 TaxID=2854779 RepID=UPI001C451866|nr:DUF1488 family protein [Bordetella sp. BOR01]MBV7484945.1 DUF1488 domain-containing protein [Bordetella sp. BOR01]